MYQICNNERVANLESHCEIRNNDDNSHTDNSSDTDSVNKRNETKKRKKTKKKEGITTTLDTRLPMTHPPLIQNKEESTATLDARLPMTHPPIQNNNNDNDKSRKRKQIQQPEQSTSSSFRIMGRKYSLTKTGYKFLDISIVPKYASSYVSITVGNHYGKGISFSPDTWKKLLEQKYYIISYLQLQDNNEKNLHQSPLCVGEILIHFGRINGIPTLYLKTSTGRLTVCKNTMLSIFDFENCVNRFISLLSSIIDNVNAKISRLYEFISTAKEPAKAIRDNEFSFDRNDIIECELMALLFPIYTTTIT